MEVIVITKFHINSKGVPAPCKAIKGNCPFGGIDSHYDNMEEAQKAADEQGKRKHSILPATNSSYLHNKYLRGKKEARPEFKFSIWQMRDMCFKFVKVNYDGKEFDGKVIDFYSDGEDNSGLIIENNAGEIKQIKNYRLRNLEITGDNEKAHAGIMQTEKVIYNIEEKYKEDEEYITIMPEDVFTKEFEDEYGPQRKVNEYFKGRISQHAGEQVNLEKFENINWNKLVEDNKDYYKETKHTWNETHGGGMNDVWTEESDGKFENDLEMSDNAYIYFAERLDLIDDTFKEVQNVDWTPHYETQLEGELSALNRIYEQGIVSN